MTKERLCNTINFRSLASAGGCVHLLTYFVRAFKYSKSHGSEPRFDQKGAQGGEDPHKKLGDAKKNIKLIFGIKGNMKTFEFTDIVVSLIRLHST